MGKCPYCGNQATSLSTNIVMSHGTGDAPYEIPVLTLSCPSCEAILGVLHPPAA